jgi:prepilin-type N-terminal cleavage/methylation domain-containing protein
MVPKETRSRRFSFVIRHSSFQRAFTLIEVMVVVAIIGLMAAMGLPSIIKALQKEGMRKAVDDMTGVFFSAREKAIVTNTKVAVVFHPRDRQFGVEGTAGEGGTIVNTHSGRAMVATLPDGVELGMLDIFRQDYVQSDWAKIFFNPDGTCDEAVIVLIAKGGAESQKITLEYATGLPNVTAVDK